MIAVLDRPEIAVETPTLDARNPYDKLADAILAGSRLVPKCTHEAILRDGDGHPIAACAVGAAMLALHTSTEHDMWAHCGIDPDMTAYGPYGEDDLVGKIVDLNDRYNWTREEIASWVRTLKGASA